MQLLKSGEYGLALVGVGLMAFLLRPPGVLELRGEPRPTGTKTNFIAELERKSAFGSVPLPVELPAGTELEHLQISGRDAVAGAEYQVFGLGEEPGWWVVCVDILRTKCGTDGGVGPYSRTLFRKKVAEVPIGDAADAQVARVYVGRSLHDATKAKPDEEYEDDWIFHVKWALAADVGYLGGDGFWAKPE